MFLPLYTFIFFLCAFFIFFYFHDSDVLILTLSYSYFFQFFLVLGVFFCLGPDTVPDSILFIFFSCVLFLISMLHICYSLLSLNLLFSSSSSLFSVYYFLVLILFSSLFYFFIPCILFSFSLFPRFICVIPYYFLLIIFFLFFLVFCLLIFLGPYTVPFFI